MSKVTLSPSLFDALGLENWHLSPEFCRMPSGEQMQTAVMETDENIVESSPIQDAPADSTEVNSEVNHVSAGDGASVRLSSDIKLIFIGQDLEQVWQAETSPAWLLMSNILQALGIPEDKVLYFDTCLLQTEDAIEMTLEEIIDTGVEQVFCFDEEGALNDVLAEGLQVEILPDLETMLAQPYAKKQCYYHLASYVG